MTAEPLVSVLMASRDGARFLPESLASLEAQTWPNVEFVLADDGSTDDTPRLLEAFVRARSAARLLRTGGVGLAAALARCAAEARGSLLARQDDDDVSEPRRLELQVAAMMRDSRLGVLGTAAVVVDENGRTLAPYPVPIEPARIRQTLRRAPPFVHGSVVMRRDVYEAAGGYRAAFRASQDYDLWLRIPASAVLANLSDVLYRWRRHPKGVFTRARSLQIRFHALARTFAEERVATGCDGAEALSRAPDFDAFLATYPRAGRFYRFLGEDLVRERRGKEAREALAQARRLGVRADAWPWYAMSFGADLVGRDGAKGERS